MGRRLKIACLLLSIACIAVPGTAAKRKAAMSRIGPGNESKVRKVVFIHHSVGGRWLAHDSGGLVSALNRKGFYVNDITYGWQPDWVQDTAANRLRNRVYDWLRYEPGGAFKIGDRTDIGHFYEWFVGADSAKIMDSVYRENNETTVFGDHGNSRSGFPLENPGKEIENEVVIIKPCYPNSLYRGDGHDAATGGDNPPRNFPAGSEHHTVANCKRIFNDILPYFRRRPDKFFVILTAPPRMELPDGGKTARVFNNWLVHDWLRENGYAARNVMVFDFYNVLTSGPGFAENDLGRAEGNHHRFWNGSEQHVVRSASNLLAYPRDGKDNHPSPAGLKKATQEFVDLFVHRHEIWRASRPG